MRRTLQWLLVGLVAWQGWALVISAWGVFFPYADVVREPSTEEQELIRSLLSPAEQDLEETRRECEELRERLKGWSEDSWENQLSAALLAVDVPAAQVLWEKHRDSLRFGDRMDGVAPALEALRERGDNPEQMLLVAEALSEATGQFDGLDRLAWHLWDGAEAAGERARILTILISFSSWDEEASVLWRAVLRFWKVAPGEHGDEIADAAMQTGAELFRQQSYLPALELFEAAVAADGNGSQWAAATYDVASSARMLGRHGLARQRAQLLLASDVNDLQPGDSLMRPAQNYRHEASRLMAQSYQAQGAYPLAYWWSLQAAERYPFRSWCGTCNEGAATIVALEVSGASFRMGPLGVVGHMLYRPGLNLHLWIPLGLAAAVTGAVVWWRRKRLAAVAPA